MTFQQPAQGTFAITEFIGASAISLLGLPLALALVVRRSLLSGLALRSQ